MDHYLPDWWYEPPVESEKEIDLYEIWEDNYCSDSEPELSPFYEGEKDE